MTSAPYRPVPRRCGVNLRTRVRTRVRTPARRAIAVAAAALLAPLAMPLGAAVVVTGPFINDPVFAGSLNAPNVIAPDIRFYLGYYGSGTFSATAGAQVQMASLQLINGAPTGTMTALLDGAGTVLSLHGDGSNRRFQLTDWGNASLTISGGALFDGRANAAACLVGTRACDNFLDNAAGSNASLTVTGAGSEARFIDVLAMGHLVAGSGWGTVGGTTNTTVQVTNGGTLRSEQVVVGTGYFAPGSNGQERANLSLTVSGVGSRWISEASTVARPGETQGAYVMFGGGDRRVFATLNIDAGGRFEVVGSAAGDYVAHLGHTGSFIGTVSGAGSELSMSGSGGNGWLGLGGGAGAASSLTVNAGGRLATTGQTVLVGHDSGNASLDVHGAGSSLFAPDAGVIVGHAGVGSLRVEGGATARMSSLVSAFAYQGSTRGRGDVVVDGTGTLVTVSSPTGMRLTAGDWGDGTITVSGGGRLDALCPGGGCLTILGHSPGTTSRFTVTGAGSEAVTEGDTWVGAIKLFTQAVDGWTLGTPGGATTTRVEVLDGGTLRSQFVNAAVAERPETTTGTERSFAEMVVRGGGSLWAISSDGGRGAEFRTGWNVRSNATLEVSQGGVMRLDSSASGSEFFLGLNGGTTSATVRDAGSQLAVNGLTSIMRIGGAAGEAALTVRDGATASQDGTSWSYLNIAETGATGRVEVRSGGTFNAGRQVNVGAGGEGTLIVDGAGSLFSADRRGTDIKELTVGAAATGSGRLEVTNGGTVSTHTLKVGADGGYLAAGTVLVDGAGSTLVADAPAWYRLSFSSGSLTVSGGGRVTDAPGGAIAPCNPGVGCGGMLLANNAGDRATVTVTGAGSTLVSSFGMTMGSAFTGSAAQAGLVNQAALNVVAGGVLQTGRATIGVGASGSFASGAERVEAAVTVRGAGSQWLIGTNPGETSTSLVTGVTGGGGGFSAANITTDLRVDQGGLLRLTAEPGGSASLILGETGGTHRLVVSGAASKVEFTGSPLGFLTLGRTGSQATMRVEAGATVTGAHALTVGRGASAQGTLAIEGAGSLLRLTGSGTSTAAAAVGQQAGSGQLVISAGGALELRGTGSQTLAIGSASGAPATSSTGSLRVDGPGSSLTYALSGATSGNAFGTLNVGAGGSGSAEVVNGGVLRIGMDGPVTGAGSKSGSITVGTLSSNLPGIGTMTVRGTGSLVEVAVPNAFFTVGTGAGGIGGTGTLNVVSGGEVRSTVLQLGAVAGATGTLVGQGGTITLTGSLASTAAPLNGPYLSIGGGTGGVGSASLSAASSVQLTAPAGSSATLQLGGAGGSGVMSVAGGSTVTLTADAGLGVASIGRQGPGVATFGGASTLAVPGGNVLVGEFASGNGILRVEGGSSVSAAYVGVGATPGTDTGVAQMIVNDTSTVTAATIEIGARGFVGGSGTLVGNVVNRGVFNPGNSPGTLTIAGSFANAAGGRLVLEVESDGNGGFVTDRLVFAGGAPALAGLQVTFSFLGSTDPTAFQAAGLFDIGQFLRVGSEPIAPALLAGASYAATSTAFVIENFSYSPQAGASFVATPVPEPATWLLWLVGALAGVRLARRRPVPI